MLLLLFLFVVLVLSPFSSCAGNHSEWQWSTVYTNDQIFSINPTAHHTIWVQFRAHSGLRQTSLVPSTTTQHMGMHDSIAVVLTIYEFTRHNNLESQYTVVNKNCPNALIIRKHKHVYGFFFNLKLVIHEHNPQIPLESLKHLQR